MTADGRYDSRNITAVAGVSSIGNQGKVAPISSTVLDTILLELGANQWSWKTRAINGLDPQQLYSMSTSR